MKGCYATFPKKSTTTIPTQGTLYCREVTMEVEILSLPCVHVKISHSCTVADPSTLYLETRASLCVYFTSVCVADVRMKLSKSTDVIIWANVCFWVFCRHLI